LEKFITLLGTAQLGEFSLEDKKNSSGAKEKSLKRCAL